MKRLFPVMLIAALFAFPPVLPAAQDDPKEPKKLDEKEAGEQIKEFRKEMKKVKSPEEQVRLLRILGDGQHATILKELAPWLATSTDDVRMTAAQEVGKYRKEKKAADALLQALVSNQKSKAVVIQIVKAVADVDIDASVLTLHAMFRGKENEVCAEAVNAAGKIRCVHSVEPLIKLLAEVEGLTHQIDVYRANNPGGVVPGGTPPAGGGAGGTPGGAPSPTPSLDEAKIKEWEARRDALDKPVHDALKNITNVAYTTSKEWESWWRQNKATFKIEEEK